MVNDTFTDEDLWDMANSVTSEEAFPDDPLAGDEEEAINSYYDGLIAFELLKAHDLAQEIMESKIDAAVVAIVGVDISDTEPIEPHSMRIQEVFDAYENVKTLLLSAKNQCIANMYAWRITTSLHG